MAIWGPNIFIRQNPLQAQCYVSCQEAQSGKQEMLFLREISLLQEAKKLLLLMKFMFLVKKGGKCPIAASQAYAMVRAE